MIFPRCAPWILGKNAVCSVFVWLFLLTSCYEKVAPPAPGEVSKMLYKVEAIKLRKGITPSASKSLILLLLKRILLWSPILAWTAIAPL